LALYLIVSGNGDWASRVGSLTVVFCLIGAFVRAKKEIWNPRDGLPVFDGGGSADYSPSKADLHKYHIAVVDLAYEFVCAGLGTFINGFGVWLACFFASGDVTC
jgi:hypothetical protein